QGKVRANQRIPGYEGLERPDIVILDEGKNTATIIDVTVAFENRQNAFELVHKGKVEKYSHAAKHLEEKGYRTEIKAFIVGSLGGYYHKNVVALIALGIGKKYSVLMKAYDIGHDQVVP
ncbi:MAG: hypothetical protein PV362_04365, partial [Providencia heimbachae]|nr:hypothetical protein [Providencia heimbachae]